jgi:hypothetical protein
MHALVLAQNTPAALKGLAVQVYWHQGFALSGCFSLSPKLLLLGQFYKFTEAARSCSLTSWASLPKTCYAGEALESCCAKIQLKMLT